MPDQGTRQRGDLSTHRTHARAPQTPSIPKPYYPVATGEAPSGGGAAGLRGGSGVLAELLGAGGCPAVAEARGARAVVRRRPGRQTGGGWSGRGAAAASSQDIGQGQWQRTAASTAKVRIH